MPVTKEQAAMLASLACASRPHGARHWDEAGVMAQLGKVNHLALPDVMMAVGRAARDRDLETPGAIGNLRAPCWQERLVERPEPEVTTAEGRCGICGKSQGRCESAPKFADDDHRFEPDFKNKRGPEVSEIVAALKAELQPIAAPPVVTPHTATNQGTTARQIVAAVKSEQSAIESVQEAS